MRGLRQNVGDMVRSMVVVLAVVGAILLVTWRPQPDPIREVPRATCLLWRAVRPTSPSSSSIPHGGAVTSVRWESTEESDGELVWHVGYVTPEEQYLQLSQSLADSASYLAEQTSDGQVLRTTRNSRLPFRVSPPRAGFPGSARTGVRWFARTMARQRSSREPQPGPTSVTLLALVLP